mgnify:CR=1 FL=1
MKHEGGHARRVAASRAKARTTRRPHMAGPKTCEADTRLHCTFHGTRLGLEAGEALADHDCANNGKHNGDDDVVVANQPCPDRFQHPAHRSADE